VRLLKIVPRKSKSLLEEYFYRFVAAICLTVMILGKAGGLSGYDAVVTGLWVGAFLWFARQMKNYRKQQAVTSTIEKSKQEMPAALRLASILNFICDDIKEKNLPCVVSNISEPP